VEQPRSFPPRVLRCGITLAVVLSGVVSPLAQDNGSPAAQPGSDAMTEAVRELQEQVRELRAAVAEVRSEAAAYHAETEKLLHELQVARTPAADVLPQGAPPPLAGSGPGNAVPEPDKPSLPDRVAALEESTQLLAGKVDEQHQTKVESASKYRVRLSGIVLMNLFGNRGSVDSQDVPSVALNPSPLDSNRTLGASLRQSELGLEVFGPRLAGARTSGQLQVDFSGGLANTSNGSNYGIVRMRTGSMRLDWEHTSVLAGQDALFLSPESPTSFASLAVPEFGYAGNLWGWIPQLRVEQRIDLSDEQKLTVQAGLLDNADGEPPFSSFNRLATAGEKSAQPALGSRVAWSSKILGQPVTVGTAGYYSRQNWGFGRETDGWAGMTDWRIPLPGRLALTGEFYRGRAIGGLGGGLGRSVLYSGPLSGPSTQIRALNTLGGWSQLKFRATSKLEFNGAYGIDSPNTLDLRAFPKSVSYYNPVLAQSRSAMFNFIYRPRSDLLFSTEYRHLRTAQIIGDSYTAEHVNMMVGVLF
jgi:hypothetical protein